MYPLTVLTILQYECKTLFENFIQFTFLISEAFKSFTVLINYSRVQRRYTASSTTDSWSEPSQFGRLETFLHSSSLLFIPQDNLGFERRGNHLTFLALKAEGKKMTEDGAAAGMEIDTAAPSPSITPVTAAASGTVQQGADKSKPRFEIKKYNAVALWAWGKFSYYTTCLIMLIIPQVF